MKKIRILIADDHKIVRIGLKALLSSERDMEVAGEADDGDSAVLQAEKLRPDVVIMDLMMPGKSGEEATAEIHAHVPEAKVLVLTSFSTSDGIARALESGAAGAVLKTSDDAALLTAVRAVADGQSFISPEVRKLLEREPPVPKLTPRQIEVLQSLTRGLTNRDIARQLGICEARVEQLVNALLSKIGAANRTEAAVLALRKHLLKI